MDSEEKNGMCRPKIGMPMAMAVALARDHAAVTAFCALSDEGQKAFIDGARALEGEEAMRRYIQRI